MQHHHTIAVSSTVMDTHGRISYTRITEDQEYIAPAGKSQNAVLVHKGDKRVRPIPGSPFQRIELRSIKPEAEVVEKYISPAFGSYDTYRSECRKLEIRLELEKTRKQLREYAEQKMEKLCEGCLEALKEKAVQRDQKIREQWARKLHTVPRAVKVDSICKKLGIITVNLTDI